VVHVLHGDQQDPPSENSQLPSISHLLLNSAKDERKHLLIMLVSRAASRHEQEFQRSKLSLLQQFFRGFELLWSDSRPQLARLNNLDFHPTKDLQPSPPKVPQFKTSPLVKVQNLSIWLMHVKAVVVQLLCLLLRLLWITPMGFVKPRPCLVFEDIIAPFLHRYPKTWATV
jgi:hypothetical protein